MITRSGLRYWQIGVKRTELVKFWLVSTRCVGTEPSKKCATFRDAARPKSGEVSSVLQETKI